MLRQLTVHPAALLCQACRPAPLTLWPMPAFTWHLLRHTAGTHDPIAPTFKSCCSVAFVLVPRKPKSPPRQKPSSRPVSPVGGREADLRHPKGSSYRGRDGREPPREYDYRSRRPLSPPRRRSSPIRDPRDYRQRRPLSPPRSRRCIVLPCPLCFQYPQVHLQPGCGGS